MLAFVSHNNTSNLSSTYLGRVNQMGSEKSNMRCHIEFTSLPIPSLSPPILCLFFSCTSLIASRLLHHAAHSTHSAPVWVMVVYRHVELMDFIQRIECLI